MRCPACAQDNGQGDRFCGSCGAALVSVTPAVVITCVHCRAPLSPEERFCGECGALCGSSSAELPIPAVTPVSRATRSGPTGIARLVFVGSLVLSGILGIIGVIVAVPEVLEGDDPSEMAVYVSMLAMLLLSISLVVLLPNLHFRVFLFISTALFLSGALVVWRFEYFSTQSGPYWAYLMTVTGPFSILGVLVGFAISKFITRKRERER